MIPAPWSRRSVAEITRITQGDVESCGTQIVVGPDGTATTEIPLRDIAKLGDWVLELNAISSEPAQLRLSLPNPFETPEQTVAGSTLVDVDSDLRTRWVSVSGGGNTLRIDVTELRGHLRLRRFGAITGSARG